MADSDSKLDQILNHLMSQGEALGSIVKRLDTIEAEVRLANQQAKRVNRRQSDLEEHYASQAGDCTGMFTRLADRLTALEQKLTPIPKPFDPDPEGNGSAA